MIELRYSKEGKLQYRRILPKVDRHGYLMASTTLSDWLDIPHEEQNEYQWTSQEMQEMYEEMKRIERIEPEIIKKADAAMKAGGDRINRKMAEIMEACKLAEQDESEPIKLIKYCMDGFPTRLMAETSAQKHGHRDYFVTSHLNLDTWAWYAYDEPQKDAIGFAEYATTLAYCLQKAKAFCPSDKQYYIRQHSEDLWEWVII